MKILFCSLVLFAGLSAGAQDFWLTDLITYRDSMDQAFSDPETSILPEEDLDLFTGLNYYEASDRYRVRAKFKRVKNGEVFEMPTTTDRLPKYRVYGKLKFRLDGQKMELTVYQNIALQTNPVYKDYLFLPFTDYTNGDGSYGGGRYLDLHIGDLEKKPVMIDFNFCYNPYCAYNAKYSCPIPPEENDLKIRIEAGVKSYH